MLKFKVKDPVIVVRPESTLRPTTIHEQAKDPGIGSFTATKPKEVGRKGVIGSLHALYIPVRLPSGKTRHVLYVDLTFGKGLKCSFKGKKPDWKGVKPDKEGIYREVVIPGKPIVLRGEAILHGLHIPVIIDGEPCQIPYEQIKFEKETK